MGTILMTWELGAGLGHVTCLAPLVDALAQRGHRVYAALKNLAGVWRVFDRSRLSYLAAPVGSRAPRTSPQPTRTFAHVLESSGFDDADDLGTRIDAWRTLYDLTRPDLVLFDHSPTALLAARGLPVKKVTAGTGFCCPPDVYPLPDLCTWRPGEPDRQRQDEDRVLETMNLALKSRGITPLERIGQLFGETDECLLTTVAELDHHRPRLGGRYLGAWNRVGGKSPEWPPGDGKRVFGYLKPFKALSALLDYLRRLGCPTLIVPDSIASSVQQKFTCPTLRFEKELCNLTEVARQCDVAILNATHGTTATMLMAGVPLLHVPLFFEQEVTTKATVDLGAGLGASPVRPEHVLRQFTAVLSNDRYRRAAQAFAAKYAAFDPAAELGLAAERIDRLIRGPV